MERKIQISRIVALLVVGVQLGIFSAASNGAAKLILTAKPYAIRSDEKFSPYDRINGTIILAAPIKGLHTLEVVWMGPNNYQNHFKSEVDFADQERQTLSVWLDLGSDGGTLSSLNSQESDNSKFVGMWKVKTWLDGQPLVESRFPIQ
jgi:hypothetical protein